MENKGEIVIYKSEDGNTEIVVKLTQDTVWLTQKQIGELFGTKSQAITKHIKNIYESGELYAGATCSKMEQVKNEGGREVKRTVISYNLDMVISIGYRVNSKKATQFRIWATNVLKNHIVKGYTIKHDRINNLEQSIALIKESFQMTKFRLEKFLINIGEIVCWC